MGRIKSIIILRMLLAVALATFFSTMGYSYIFVNGSGSAYVGTDGSTEGKRVTGTGCLQVLCTKV